MAPARRPAAPTEPAFGCVDWYLYDSGNRAGVARGQARDRDSRSSECRRGLTPGEERKLMGYVR